MNHTISLYLYTPFVHNSKYIPHLVEHACFWKMTEDLFLRLERQTEAYVKGPVTVFKIHAWDKSRVDEVISRLCQWLDPKIIQKEQKTLRDELSRSTYYQRLYESIGKQFIKKDFDNTKPHRVKTEDIIHYHAQYYQPKKFHNLEQSVGISIRTDSSSPEVSNFVFEDDDYILESQENSPENLIFSFLLTELRNDWLRFYLRYKKNIYRYDECIPFYYESICVSVIPKNLSWVLWEMNRDFKIAWQKYAKESISSWLWKNIHYEYRDFLWASLALFWKIPDFETQSNVIDSIIGVPFDI